MEAKDLKVGDKLVYQEDPNYPDEKCEVKVTGINLETEKVHFMDLDDFDWEEKFEDIPNVIVRKLN